MINWEGYRRNMAYLRYYHSVRIEGMRKTVKATVRITGSKAESLTQEPHKYE
jgi:hypothetical protein